MRDLRKPNILIPLSASSSRGDQILNSESFNRQGFSYVIKEEELTSITLLEGINAVYSQRENYINNMSKSQQLNSIDTIINLINEIVNPS